MIEKATPIWTGTEGINQYIDAVREFEIDNVPPNAELTIYIGYYPIKPGFSEYELKPVERSLLKSIKADLLKPGL